MNGLDLRNEPYAWLRVDYFLSDTLLFGGSVANGEESSIRIDMAKNKFFRHVYHIELDGEVASYALSIAADHTVVEEAGVVFVTRQNESGEPKFGVIARTFREDPQDNQKVTCALPAVWNARLETNRENIHEDETYFPFVSPKGDGFLVYDVTSNVLWNDQELALINPQSEKD